MITTQDGRNLAYLEVGDPHGPLVIHNHGGPSSRFEARLFANSASKHRLRLICVDRPGMGQSSPQKTRTYSGWADDLTTIADALGYHEFGVTGWSEGVPWALAAAAYIDPVRLRHVSSIAGATEHSAKIGQRMTFPKSTRWGDSSHCILNLASASCMRPLA
ncbi:MAG: alpha/beta hydrolase [Aphanocapsa sp. GSE-SYN-MK-11-07L]|jgi:pimeloyl-ACP methyl ester carboxylesterase|nr:alpha/beta hydrolase [Aphanocapsa sp. GSE-SYN-MK-11-07L]